MYYPPQKEQPNEIIIYKRCELNGKIIAVAKFESIEQLFSVNYKYFGWFSSDFNDTYGPDVGYPYYRLAYWDKCPCLHARIGAFPDVKYYCYLVFDSTHTHYSRDRLIGLYRKWNERYRKCRGYRRWRRTAWRRCRKIKTFHEHKWAHAWDDEDFSPKVRAKRQGNYLPTYWDDIRGHTDKCWKTQSNRKRQWKVK